MKFLRVIAIVFTLLIILLVYLADIGMAQPLFGAFYAFPYGDAVVHSLLMGTLSFLINLAFLFTRLKSPPVLKSCLVIAGVITLEEVSQLFIPGRTFSLIDLAGDYLGIFLFGELGAALRKVLLRRA